jgi:hypothetical protein
MTDLYYLSFRDVTNGGTGVTAGEIYHQPNVDGATDWTTAALTGGEWVPWTQVASVFRGKRVCFLLHGFNVPLKSAVQSLGPAAQAYESLGALALNMTGADLVVPVVWPGDGFIGWSYFTATDHAKTTGARFADFLLGANFPAAQASFFSHSLGALVVLETVSQTLARNPKPPFRFDTAILAAPAVDDNALDDPNWPGAAAGLRRIVVLSSMQDTVLQYAFVAGDAVEGALWWSYDPDCRALGRYGPAFKNGSIGKTNTEWYAIDDPIKQNHGDYLPDGSAQPAWSPKPTAVGMLCRDVINPQPFNEPQVRDNWATDRTGDFRAGWMARL